VPHPTGVLFVTRKFPPSVGGMQSLSAGVWRSLAGASADNRLIAHGGENRDLVWWVPVALVRLAGQLARRQVGAVLTGDALMWALAEPLLRLARVERATMVMGLDVTYPGRLYQALVRPALRRAPHVIAISAATAAQAEAAGVPADRVEVLRLGVAEPAGLDRAAARAGLLERVAPGDQVFLLATLGRLVRRKGVEWFVREILPALPEHVHYLVAGEGPERPAIAAAAGRAGVAGRVHLLGQVDGPTRAQVLGGSDLFVQPNIPVAGDMEGFGLVVVEAAMAGTPVVAARLEGISDAVADGETGILVPPGDARAWIEALLPLVGDPAAAARFGQRFGRRAAELYREEQMGRTLTEILSRSQP
jgi:phosphatidyl-myo-inositol dimannoside synthase